MRLLIGNDPDTFGITTDLTEDIPPYAILSHTWGADGDEVTFADLQQGRGRGQTKAGYAKIQFCGKQARKDGIKHFWVDTCCIDKANNSELTEAITSMYRWYHKAQKCYVYLADVSTCTSGSNNDAQPVWESTFRASRWFTRGWTLQELLAPEVVEFYSCEGDFLGTKRTLAQQIHEITTIPIATLLGASLSQSSIRERIRWTEKRQTKKKEDKAYCLLGIFDVFMPLIYGEGDNALRRLQKEINEQYGSDVAASLTSDDQTGALGLCLNSAPVIKSSEFIGRTLEISTIHDLLRPGEPSVEQRRVILGGIGGMGKTQLAIAYARQYQHSYATVLWLNATSEQTLYASFRSLAPGIVAAEELARVDDKQLLVHTHRWLCRPDNTRWLLVFDNYDDPEQFSIDEFSPNIGHGSIVITTRLPDLVTGQQMRVQPLEAIDDSLAVLQVRSGRPGTKRDQGARRLAERLGGLPLALVTAGAFLRKSVSITFQQYLDAYDQRWKVDRRRNLQLPEYRDRTLYTTWDLTYRKLLADDLEAARMLQLLAYFDNQDVWHALLRAGLSDQAPAWLQTILSEDSGFDSVMGTLVDYCLIEVRPATESYSMHNCFHDWVLGELNKEVDPQMYWYAFDCVAASINKNDWKALGHAKYARVSQHGIRLTHHRFRKCDESDSDRLEHLDGAEWIAKMLQGQLQLSAAEQMYIRILTKQETALGPDHILTLRTISALGNVYDDQGRFEESEKMHKRALAGYEETLSPDHPSTFIYVNNLGVSYRSRGRLDDAEQMFERALTGWEKTLGPDHEWTLATLNDLASFYRHRGKLAKIEPMYLRALAGKERASGPNDVTTLTTIANLGILYHDQGRLDEAKQMNDQLLERGVGLLRKGDCCRDVLRIYIRALRRSIKTDSINRSLPLLQLLNIVKQWKNDPFLYLEPARAMVYCDDENNSQEAYRYCARHVYQQRADYHETFCDSCQRLIEVEMGLHVCRQCLEIDLCDQCMSRYNKGETVVVTCTGHEFFHVDKSASVVFDSVAVDTTAEMMAWIDRAIAKYTTLAGDNDVQSRRLDSKKKDHTTLGLVSVRSQFSLIGLLTT